MIRKEKPKSSEELYEMLVNEYTVIYGISKVALDNKINSYIKKGLSREDAIRKVAKEYPFSFFKIPLTRSIVLFVAILFLIWCTVIFLVLIFGFIFGVKIPPPRRPF